jgi:pterin-4a-carbinolamine dehydratase
MRKSARICRIYGLSINGFQICTDHLQKYLDPWQIHFCTNQRKIRRICGFKDVKEFLKFVHSLRKNAGFTAHHCIMRRCIVTVLGLFDL